VDQDWESFSEWPLADTRSIFEEKEKTPMVNKDKIKNLVEQGATLREIIKEAAKEVIKESLSAEADLFIADNQEILSNGKLRLVLNGKYPERDVLFSFGSVPIQAPRVKDRAMTPTDSLVFTSRLLPKYLSKSEDMKELIPWLYLKGFAERDFQSVFETFSGHSVRGLSASSIRNLLGVWDEEYANWSKRDLSSEKYPYLWADGVYFRVRGEKENLCQLIILGVDENGDKHLLGSSDGYAESADAWRSLLLQLRHQGMNDPKLVTGDAGLGLWAGLREVYPDCRRQYCLFHVAKNITENLPNSLHRKGTKDLKNIYLSPTQAEASKQMELFDKIYRLKYPKVADIVKRKADDLLTFYDFPAEHWTHLRTTNPIESFFSTLRLRTNKIRGQMGRHRIGALLYKLSQVATSNFRSISGAEQLKLVLSNQKFKDGELIKS
jgi:transposase-like protein